MGRSDNEKMEKKKEKKNDIGLFRFVDFQTDMYF